MVAAFMGVAGGELHGIDLKLAGSLSLMVSLPRAPRQPALRHGHGRWLPAGCVGGGALLPYVDSRVLIPLLVGILLISAAKVWQYR